jgi:hypothetical protein
MIKEGNPAKGKRTLVQFKDLVMSYMMADNDDKMSEIRELSAKTSITKATHRRAIKALEVSRNPVDVSSYKEWVNSEYGSSDGRGRSPPSIGERRVYKVQQIKSGGPFIRLPLDSLKETKGGRADVLFEEGVIKVLPQSGPPTQGVVVVDDDVDLVTDEGESDVELVPEAVSADGDEESPSGDTSEPDGTTDAGDSWGSGQEI